MIRLVKAFLLLPAIFIITISQVSCSKESKGNSPEPVTGKNEKITNVETSVVTRSNFEDVLELTGTAEAFRTVTISSEETGKITHLSCDEGNRVKKGTILLKQDTELLSLQVKVAESNFALAETNHKRIKKLFDRGSTSNQEMQSATVNRDVARAQLDLAKLHLDRAIIKSPLSGIIVAKYAEFGEMLAPGMPVCKIIDTETLKIITGIPEQELPFLKKDAPVEFTFDAYPGRVFQGKISYVGAAGDTSSGTFPLEMQYDNENNEIIPGMIARVRLIRRVVENAVVIYQNAVIDRENVKYVFSVESKFAREVVVEVGPTDGKNILITKGLSGGEQLIIIGHRDLVDGEKVNIIKVIDAETAK